MTEYLRENAAVSDTSVLRSEDGGIERAIMFIGGWSKSAYLPEVDCFYPD